jgi:hypothetical protein
MYNIQHCFIRRPSDSIVSEDAGIEPRTVAATALAVRRSNHSARSQMRKVKRHYNIYCRKRRRDITEEETGPAEKGDETLLQRKETKHYCRERRRNITAEKGDETLLQKKKTGRFSKGRR